MSHYPDCIEIRPTGEVTAGGNLVGTIAFAGRDGILGRLYGVGVHTLNGHGDAPDQDDLDEAWDQLGDARLAVHKAIEMLSRRDPDIRAAVAVLRGWQK